MNFHDSGLFEAFIFPCVDKTAKLQNVINNVLESEKYTEWWRCSDHLYISDEFDFALKGLRYGILSYFGHRQNYL